uniref:Uncharacterized protein n=1 Tax=Oryza nivara TaxID=4536 RepID=A0A0E0HAN9_ORYNI
MAGGEVTVSVSPTKKRKGESSALDGGEDDALAHPSKKKKMWLLPKEEVDWILAQSNEPICARFRELKRANPSLVPSPEEEKDEYTMLLYECTRESYEDEAKYAKFQAWVRGEYARKGFVEVDYDYFAKREEAIRLNEEAREEVLGHWSDRHHPSHTDLDDEDWKLVRSILERFDQRSAISRFNRRN